jgi:hypothetical protein
LHTGCKWNQNLIWYALIPFSIKVGLSACCRSL